MHARARGLRLAISHGSGGSQSDCHSQSVERMSYVGRGCFPHKIPTCERLSGRTEAEEAGAAAVAPPPPGATAGAPAPEPLPVEVEVEAVAVVGVMTRPTS